MLCQDYLTYGTLAKQSAARSDTPMSGHCRICLDGVWEDVRHIVTECQATLPARNSIFPKIKYLLEEIQPSLDWQALQIDKANLIQLIVDPCSMNLPNSFRVPLNHPNLIPLISILRDLCFCCHNLRTKALEALKVNRSAKACQVKETCVCVSCVILCISVFLNK